MLSFWTALVLLSSCNTRKGLDAFFDIPFQKTLNVSKAKVQQNGCSQLEWNQINTLTNTSVEVHDYNLSSSYIEGFESLNAFSIQPIFSIPKTKNYVTSTPALYVLYQRFKVDLV